MFIAACLASAGAHAQPTIATEPANQNVFPGGTAVFSVAASGAGPLSYQWQFQGTNLPASFITIEAGDGYSGYYGDGGLATNAELNVPEGIAFDATGNLYIADTANSLVRKVAVNGNISTVAGNGVAAYTGDGGPTAKASLNQPESVAVDAAGNLYIADTLNSVIRKVNAAGIITTFAGNGRYAYAGDGGLATKAALNQPSGVAVDSGGNLYIADTLNSVVRKVNAGGDIATVAGNGTSAYSGDGGPATQAALNHPAGVAVDPWGNLYIADTLNSVVRKVNTSGAITTVAGNGTSAYSGDGGPATNASLSQPAFVTLDSSGNLYIADSGNDVVREVTATGLIGTVAGGGLQSPEYADDATNAYLIGTGGLAFRGAGHLYIGDPGDAFICQVALGYSQGATLSLSDISSNNVGAYDVVVSDGSESVVSPNAILTLEPTFAQNYFPLAVDTTFAFDETNSLNLQIIYQGNYLMTETYPGVYEALDLDADANSVSLVEAGTGWVHASFNPPALLVDDAALQNGGTLTTSTTSEGYAATYSVAIGKAGTITVPAGTFYNCRSFTASESLDGTHATALTAYLAPGVGIIKLLVKSGDWAELTGGTVNGYDVSAYAGMQLATTSPTLSITSPKSGLAASNDVLAVTGSAAAAVAVQSVYYQLNGGSWMLAASANSWTNWTANVNLTPGANTINVYAQDTSGNTSPTITISNFYVVTGSLQVALAPPVAVADGARWQVDGGAWQTNGVTMSNLLVGVHSLSFKPVGGFKTPANQTVSISSNLITQVLGTYLDTNPPALTIVSPTAGQRVSNGVFTVTGKANDNVAVASVYVQVNGTGWNAAGSTNSFTNWTNNVTLSPGSNYVQACATDTSGNSSLTNGVSVTYVVTGSLQVALTPVVAVADGARWQVDGGAWQTNGVTISNLLVGSHSVSFKPVAGFKTPANQTVSISSNLISQAVGTYFDTNPPNLTIVSPTAGQRVSNGVFTVAGTAHDNVAVASVYVQVNGTGWVLTGSSNAFTNWSKNVTLLAGSNYVQAYATDTSGNNSLTNGVSVTYVVTGSLQGILTPTVAVADGARWQVDGGAWQTNGVTISNLLVGGHSVSFKPVAGFKTPTNQTVSISSNLITQTLGTYFDTNPPNLTIVSPTAGQRVSNGVFTVTGTAHDNVAVASVHIALNNTGWVLAGSTNSSANWTNNATLSPGTNTLQVYATDSSGNNSLTNDVQFVFVPSAILTVRTNGNGGISPADNGKLLAIGTNYTLTATAGNNWLFSNWVGGGTTPYAVLTNGSALQFAMQSNLVLQANFVTNPFLAGAGSAYYGLFTPATAVRQNTNSGAFTFTYGSTGTVSGTIWLGPDTVNLSSNFDVSGRVRMVSPRHGESNLITTLQLDFADGTVSGQVTDGCFVAQLDGYRDVWMSRNPATNYQGSYTLIIPGTNDASVGPLGTGFGTVTVDAMGNITFSGSLADGTTGLSQHSVVSQEGLWAFYLPLYGGSGSFWAWNLFTNGTMDSLPLEASWINTTNSTKGALYRSGFTNQNAQIIGSPYNSTNKPLLALTNGEVILDGGGLAANLTNSILLATNNTITVVTNIVRNTNHLNLSIDKTHGIISGSFTNPTNSNQTISVNGVLLQNLTNAAGYFLGTNQSGAFLLDSP
jgi:hypothetical protein